MTIEFHDVALSAIAFLSELLGTLSGFGSSTFFVPAALFVESFQFVLALTAILHCFGNFFRIWLFREGFEWKYLSQLVLPAVVFTVIGAALTATVSVEWMMRALGVLLIALSVVFFVGKHKLTKLPTWASVILSGLSGFSTGFVGTGGAIRGLALSAMQLPKTSFVITSASIDILGDALRAVIYIRNGFMDWHQWFYIPILGLVAYAGAKLGKNILNKISQQQFEKIVSVFIFISGIMMLFKK
ncbi:MAG: sulfite exporter TauE/SafE family protein [Bdellovibrionales bacterium]|nr:sulfite exporter TauE/SafE family protein [Bdellovibrionales bacterium]